MPETEAQQKLIQSNIGQLSPREDDLAEIRQREQQLVDLLSAQKHQQQQYEELSKLQRERLEEQTLFLEERKVRFLSIMSNRQVTLFVKQ